jgi:hypothetical protein
MSGLDKVVMRYHGDVGKTIIRSLNTYRVRYDVHPGHRAEVNIRHASGVDEFATG